MKPPSSTRSVLRTCARCRSAASSVLPSPRSLPSTRRLPAQQPRTLPRVQTRWISNTPTSLLPSQPQQAFVEEGEPAANPPSPTKTPQTHYDLFPQSLPQGPPPRGHFPIDVRALRREFLQLQAKAHPDRHPPERRAAAQGTSARINEAFKTLANPLLRAQYLLSLRGIEAHDDERGKVEDPGLLMEVMEVREEIEEAAAEEDLVDLKRVNDGRIAASEEVLERAFREDDIESAVREVVRLRYWVNIKEVLDHWEPGKRVEMIH